MTSIIGLHVKLHQKDLLLHQHLQHPHQESLVKLHLKVLLTGTSGSWTTKESR